MRRSQVMRGSPDPASVTTHQPCAGGVPSSAQWAQHFCFLRKLLANSRRQLATTNHQNEKLRDRRRSNQDKNLNRSKQSQQRSRMLSVPSVASCSKNKSLDNRIITTPSCDWLRIRILQSLPALRPQPSALRFLTAAPQQRPSPRPPGTARHAG
jgi:hypothetical protein